MGIDEELARYLTTGDYDMTFAAWPGGWFKNRGTEDLKAALVAEVQRRTQGLRVPNSWDALDRLARTACAEARVRGSSIRRRSRVISMPQMFVECGGWHRGPRLCHATAASMRL